MPFMADGTDPISAALFERAKRILPGGVNSPVRAFRSVGGTPFFTVRAEGPYLYTADGRRLIDFVCTWGPSILGHGHPAVREAVAEALARGTSFGTPSPAEVEMAELLVELVPSLEMVRMCNSGTEATMSCVRLARGATGRSKILKFAGCYHGHVDSLLVKAGSGALTGGHPDSAGIPAAVAAETLVLDYNDLPALEQLFAGRGSELAGVILEPYPANVGLLLPDAGYLERLRELCTQHGVVLIFDEVMTGFRLGLAGVQGLTSIRPDLTALGKIIGGGLPVGAFGGRRDLMEHLAPLGPVYQAGTLSGNPLAMAAGLAQLRLLQQTSPYAALDAAGASLATSLRSAAAAHGLAAQVPQVGSMLSVFFNPDRVRNYPQALASNVGAFRRLFQAALTAGVYLPPSAYETWFLSAAHTPAVMAEAAERLTAALATAADQ